MNDLTKLQQQYDAFLRAWEMDADADTSQVVTTFDYDYPGYCAPVSPTGLFPRGNCGATSVTTTSITIEWQASYYNLYATDEDCNTAGPYPVDVRGDAYISIDQVNWTELSPVIEIGDKVFRATATGLTSSTLYYFKVIWDVSAADVPVNHTEGHFQQETLADESALVYIGSAAMLMGGGEIEIGEDCDDYRELIFGHLFKSTTLAKPSTLAVALCTSQPSYSHCGWNMPEVNAGIGYSRQTPSWGTVSGGVITNSTSITFGPATIAWGIVSHFVVIDTATYGEGSIVLIGTFSPTKFIQQRDKIIIPIGAISLSVQ